MQTSRFILVIAALATCSTFPGCDREDRDLNNPPPTARPIETVQMSPLIPGIPNPTTQPAALRPAGWKNPYEENAYGMSEGQRLYKQYNCNGCHANGGGDIGPPLMDNKWIYGSEPEQVVATIVQGRPNGMPAFGTKVPEYQVWQIAAYVRSMSGLVSFEKAPAREDHMHSTPPPNTKDPEKPRETRDPQ